MPLKVSQDGDTRCLNVLDGRCATNKPRHTLPCFIAHELSRRNWPGWHVQHGLHDAHPFTVETPDLNNGASGIVKEI